ncbi:methyltransferase [Mycobacterium sp. 236(2023)]|uniref:methyltransferase n=1 Tax=Mycobacterium sp. 236(2023) TaxID=3038163 RepID=UPI002414EF20|nr:methyltransferase [Mycobacterium sp. 236(2023)]MDG4666994.1 methyltransferase domain-containing protein [Mycobacterium sp. 236(2023)]
MALRGERFLSSAAAVVGGRRFKDRIAGQASRYWSAPADSAWEANSHWRRGIGDEAWLEVGSDHWAIYETFARALQLPRPGTVMEWGAGGGANAVAFAPHAQRFIAADISQDTLDECVRQVRETCATPIETRVIDLADPGQAVAGLTDTCDVFLCLYVFELTTGVDAVRAILDIAKNVLVPGGLALVQVKYHTAEGRTRGRAGVTYDRNMASTTTFGIEEFWQFAADNGLDPRLITLVPENRLDCRYAYFALTTPTVKV